MNLFPPWHPTGFGTCTVHHHEYWKNTVYILGIFCYIEVTIWFCVGNIGEKKIPRIHTDTDEPKLLSQLKSTEMKVSLLINFEKEEVEVERLVY